MFVTCVSREKLSSVMFKNFLIGGLYYAHLAFSKYYRLCHGFRLQFEKIILESLLTAKSFFEAAGVVYEETGSMTIPQQVLPSYIS